MAFLNIRFPERISYGSSGGPGFRTNIVEVRSEQEQRVSRRSVPRRSYNARYGVRSKEDMAELRTFFLNVKGAAHSFRYKDPDEFTTADDHTSLHEATDEPVQKLDGTSGVTGGGAGEQFQLVKRFTVNGNVVVQKVTKPVDGTVLVAIDGTPLASGFSVDHTTGILTITNAQTAGGAVSAGFQYDQHVRFTREADDLLEFSIDDFDSHSIPNAPLIEVLDESPINDERPGGGGRYVEMSGDYSLDLGASAYSLDPNGSDRVAFIPDPSSVPVGDDWFIVKNVGSSNTVTVRVAPSTDVVVLSAGDAARLVNMPTSSASQWEAL